MATTPGNTGAKLWEQAVQNGSAQPSIPLITGGPEAVIYAPVGAICTDETGKLWVKSTDASVATGWKYATLNAAP